MSKRCCYKNCDTKIGGNFTLFTFPKEENRYCEWIKRSKCNPNEITTQSCICEKHFLSQYISSNPRRKVLLGNALPLKYCEQNLFPVLNHSTIMLDECNTHSIDGGDEINRKFYEIDPISDDEEHHIVIPNDNMIYGDEDYNLGYKDDDNHSDDSIIIPTNMDIEESPTPTTNKLKSILNVSNNMNKNETDIVYEIPKNKLCLLQSTTSTHSDNFNNINSKKDVQDNLAAITTKTTINPSANLLSFGNKINPITTSITTPASTITKTTSINSTLTTTKDEYNKECSEKDEISTTASHEITTFIFKGEEYVQMPKRIYMEEIDRMSTDLTKYKNIIINFKKLLDGINFD